MFKLKTCPKLDTALQRLMKAGAAGSRLQSPINRATYGRHYKWLPSVRPIQMEIKVGVHELNTPAMARGGQVLGRSWQEVEMWQSRWQCAHLWFTTWASALFCPDSSAARGWMGYKMVQRFRFWLPHCSKIYYSRLDEFIILQHVPYGMWNVECKL